MRRREKFGRARRTVHSAKTGPSLKQNERDDQDMGNGGKKAVGDEFEDTHVQFLSSDGRCWSVGYGSPFKFA